MSLASSENPVLEALSDLFYESLGSLGEFRKVTGAETPQPQRGLLDHDSHMTVKVEAFHNTPVDVQVLQTHANETHYARKILLTRKTDAAIVQFGLVRLNFSFLPQDAWKEIESQKTPLGRVLIEHDVLRQVMLLHLWEITPGAELQEHFAVSPLQKVYGRTAFIYCNQVPAVELLEIVSPT